MLILYTVTACLSKAMLIITSSAEVFRIMNNLKMLKIIAGGETLQQPDEEVSNGQSISFTLTVNVTEVTIDWLTLYRRTFNGKIPGPTWRVRRGDVVTVTLVRRVKRSNHHHF